MPTAVLVTVGRRQYWANLEWATLSTADELVVKARRKELQDLVGRRGLRCERRCPGYDNILSFGYAESPESLSRPASHPALAAAAADIREEPWVGMFCLDEAEDLWWLVAVTEGQSIIPNGDVVGTREEIEAARLKIQGLRPWTFEEGDLNDLAALLTLPRGPGAPKHLSRAHAFVWRPAWWQVALVVLILAALAVAHVTESRLEREAAARAARARHLQMLALRRKMSLAHYEAVHAKPWRLMATPSGFERRCLRVLSSTPADFAGWAPDKITCDGRGGVTWVWTRDPWGTLRSAPPGAVGANGDQVTEYRGNTFVAHRLHSRSARDALSAAVGERALYAWAQSGDVRFSMVAVSPAATLPGMAKPVPAAGDSLYTSHHAQAVMPIPSFLDRLDHIPSARIASLALTHARSGAFLWVAHLEYWTPDGAALPLARPGVTGGVPAGGGLRNPGP